MEFEWNDWKAKENLRRHGISFSEASTVFSDFLSSTIPDPLHSEAEERLVTLGCSEQQRLLVVVHTERGDVIRIISARKATTHERKNYEQSNARPT
ncbi:BrnT family toxin [Candidatus Poribacteria bacterium]|nr:BrnT family toxin [Candidatus Poribacteria bacterium]MYH82002.1 BrnT family toxin [Candidatus Poribacteria bacterium]MYK94544.1 BrnT family toxin [Candidatus Poribacteria bacterium]